MDVPPELSDAMSVAYIVRSYPRLSQTFILGEVLMLERLGVRIRLFSLTNPHEPVRQKEVADVKARTSYLEDAVGRAPWKIAWEQVCVASATPLRYLRAFRCVLSDIDHDAGYASSTRYECFLYAVHLARTLRRERRAGHADVDHLHAHFAHDPTLVALLTHLLTGIPYSFTAHARDLYQVRPATLVRRAHRAVAVITCCRANSEYLEGALPPHLAAKVRLVHHGVDGRTFHPRPRAGPAREPLLIMAVGRLVEKKGFADLVGACKVLADEGRSFDCVIYGNGPQTSYLSHLVARLHLQDRVSLPGPCPRDRLVPIYQRADIFALTPFVTPEGDRDGIPNALLEAMACGLPVVTSGAGGIRELVTDGVNGLIVKSRDAEAIATTLAALLDDAPLRERLGSAARRTVVERFDAFEHVEELAALFRSVRGEPCLQVA
ncbi:MAG: glycosyltransferase [Actinomycetota bacterium]